MRHIEHVYEHVVSDNGRSNDKGSHNTPFCLLNLFFLLCLLLLNGPRFFIRSNNVIAKLVYKCIDLFERYF